MEQTERHRELIDTLQNEARRLTDEKLDLKDYRLDQENLDSQLR